MRIIKQIFKRKANEEELVQPDRRHVTKLQQRVGLAQIWIKEKSLKKENIKMTNLGKCLPLMIDKDLVTFAFRVFINRNEKY